MNFNYEDYVKRQLNICKYDLYYDDLEIAVANEQLFDNNNEDLIPNSIYVIIKYLSSNITYEGITMPVQMLVLCEENNLERTQILLSKFAKDNNWKTEYNGSEIMMQQYSTPVVLNNFNEISYGWRSVMYLAGTLFLLEDVLNIENIQINNEPIKPTGFTFSYVMNGDTQPIGLNNKVIASTIKSVATISISIVLPFKKYGSQTTDILKVSTGKISGNTNFNISFTIEDEDFSFDMKLINCTINKAPNEIPGLQLGFMV